MALIRGFKETIQTRVESDPAFRKARTAAHLVLMTEMARMVENGQAAGRVDGTLDPVATAAAMLAMLERLLAYRSELQRRGLFRTEYEGATLRENLGLPRPASRYA